MDANTMQQVVEELVKRGIPATLEYPGFINVADRLDFGDANDTLSYDIRGDVDGEFVGGEDSDIPRNSSDVVRITNWIACTWSEFEVNSRA